MNISGDDFSKYRDMFVQEANEHVQSLNLALLELEKNGQKTENLDSAFRAAHTLKGMAATMGYEQIRQLCKVVEELFGRLRKGEISLSSNIADFLFSSFDTLNKMVNNEKIVVDIANIMNEFQNLKVNLGAGDSLDKSSTDMGYSAEDNGPPGYPRELNQSISGCDRAGEKDHLTHDVHSNQNQSSDGSVVPPINVKSGGDTKGTSLTQSRTRTIRVKMDELDSLVDLVGEIMIAKMRLESVITDSQDSSPRQVFRNLQRLITNLQNQTMKIRLVPVEEIFNRFPRMVRDISASQGKEVKFGMEGIGIEIDRTVLDSITDPLLHMLRNAVDHGIEFPDERERLGKPRAGTIKLKASRLGDKVSIEVSDDGRGIDLERVKEKAIEERLVSRQDADVMSPEQIVDLLGAPGLSTAQQVTDLSGRGVGLNVVISKIESVGGTVRIRTTKNIGTTFVMTIPLSLAIISGLLVRIGDEKYIVPLSSIQATIQVEKEAVKNIQGNHVIMFRDKVLPLLYASELLSVSSAHGEGDKKVAVIVIEKAGKPLGLVVDSFENKQDVVLKRIDKVGYGPSSNAPTEATILSNGRVALILDTAQLEAGKV